ncbi:MAG: HlyC/CorC family transporter [Phycisphaerae bacterium]|nr:HlyC/CorC family transporter [Phycisphaerae bacterium]
MPTAHLVLIPVLMGLMLASAACSSSETGLFSLSYHDRVRLRKLSPGAADAVARLLAEPRAALITLLLLNTLVNVTYMVLSSLLVVASDSTLGGIAVNTAMVLALIVLSEIFPKTLAARHRVVLMRHAARPLRAVFVLLGPVRVLLDRGIVGPLARVASGSAAGGEPLSVAELAALLELTARGGAIDRDEQRLLAQVVALGSLRVRDVMVPRIDLVWLPLDATPDRIAAVVRESQLTRIPVYRRSPDDDVVGWLLTKRYLAEVALGKNPALDRFIEPARFVPQNARLDQLLDLFRGWRVNAAMCANEHGAVTGLVRIEDIAERLIAELGEEGGTVEAGEDVRRVGPGAWSVPGRLTVRDWTEMFGVPVRGRVSTVAGLVLALLGRIPRVGDEAVFGTITLRIESVSGRVVDRVLVTLRDGGGGAGPSHERAVPGTGDPAT